LNQVEFALLTCISQQLNF